MKTSILRTLFVALTIPGAPFLNEKFRRRNYNPSFLIADPGNRVPVPAGMSLPMATEAHPGSTSRLTPVQWLICVIAAVGFAFDIYEILMLPLIVRPALLELTGAAPGSPLFQMWVGRLFYIPAVAGGIFGLLGGYLTDLFGRRRVLTFSILIYAVAAFASGFSTSIGMLLLLRCFVYVGVCVEFVAAVAWLAELFPEPKRREKVLGYTQAFSSLGGLLVATANGLCVAYTTTLPGNRRLRAERRHRGSTCAVAVHADVGRAAGDSADPRQTLSPRIASVAPEEGRRHARAAEHRGAVLPALRRTTIVTTLMFAMVYGATFGALQQVPQIVPGLSEVRERTAARAAGAGRSDQSAGRCQRPQGAGDGRAGRAVASCVPRGGDRRAAGVCCGCSRFPASSSYPGFCAGRDVQPQVDVPRDVHCGAADDRAAQLLGKLPAACVPDTPPRDGESFAANLGGRLVGTSFAWVTATLAITADRAYAPRKVALVAAAVGLSVYLVGFVATFWLPEPQQAELPE